MTEDKKFLVDVGMKDLPFPIKATSRTCPGGQDTVANISINARIMHELRRDGSTHLLGLCINTETK